MMGLFLARGGVVLRSLPLAQFTRSENRLVTAFTASTEEARVPRVALPCRYRRRGFWSGGGRGGGSQGVLAGVSPPSTLPSSSPPGSPAAAAAAAATPVPEGQLGLVGMETSDKWRMRVRNRDIVVPLAEYQRMPRHPLKLVLDNLRSAFNVGSIFRSADTARCAEVVTCGYTCHPPHAKLQKTALGAEVVVPTRHFACAVAAVRRLQREGFKCFALETTAASLDYSAVDYAHLCAAAGQGEGEGEGGVAVVLGNEATGVSPAVLEQVDGVLEIPMFGYKNSLNVATAAGIVCFEIIRQLHAAPTRSSNGAETGEGEWDGSASQGEGRAKEAVVASVPFVITRAMRFKLQLLGHSEEAIHQLTPKAAHDLLQEAELPAKQW